MLGSPCYFSGGDRESRARASDNGTPVEPAEVRRMTSQRGAPLDNGNHISAACHRDSFCPACFLLRTIFWGCVSLPLVLMIHCGRARHQSQHQINSAFCREAAEASSEMVSDLPKVFGECWTQWNSPLAPHRPALTPGSTRLDGVHLEMDIALF